MSKHCLHVSDIKNIKEATRKQIMNIKPDFSFSLNEIDDVRTMGTKYDMGQLDVICKGRCADMPIRISASTLLNISKKNIKDINLILNRKRKYFHVEEKCID
jgi:hypothetical protein